MELRKQNEGEPYRATKLWNDMILTFRSEIPRRKHRRHMRQYDNCFSGSEAVSWLLLYLRSNHNFGPHITRAQTVQLLQKFHRSGVFEDVRGFKNTREKFQDDSRLYMLLKRSPKKPCCEPKSPSKAIRPPLAPVQTNAEDLRKSSNIALNKPRKLKESISQFSLARKSSVRERFENRGNFKASNDAKDILRNPEPSAMKSMHESYDLIQKANSDSSQSCRITIFDVHSAWKNLTLKRIQSTLKLPSLDEILDVNAINPQDIIHNSYRIGKTGVVTLLDKTEDLPHWVTSAMKCLIKWPSAIGSASCLPNYNGFGRDVFHVLVDYFNGLENPLISYEFFHLFVTIFIRSEYLDHENKIKSKESAISQTHDLTASVTSINNLISELSLNSKPQESTSVPQNLDTRLKSGSVHQNSILVVQSNQAGSKSSADFQLPPHSYYETAFEHETPVTRIIPSRKSLRKCSQEDKTRFCGDSLDYNVNGMIRSYSTDNVFKSALTRNSSDVRRRSERQARSPVESNRNYLTVRKIKRGNEQKRFSQREQNSHSVGAKNRSRADDLGATNFSGYINHGFRILSQEDLRNVSSNLLVENSGHLPQVTNSLTSSGNLSDLADTYGMNGNFNIQTAASMDDVSMIGSPIYQYNNTVTCDDCPIMTEALKLACLLLPSVYRRHLHLIFRVINRISANEELCLDPVSSNKEVAMKELSQSILRPKNKNDCDEFLIQKIINFLLENCEAVFRVHDELKCEVEESLIEYRRVQHLNMPFTFCEQISNEEFEDQKQQSPNTMLQLLDGIVCNEKLSGRDKKKKLLQFKELYPDIFGLRFPDDENEVLASLHQPKAKSSKPQLLTRIKSIRI